MGNQHFMGSIFLPVRALSITNQISGPSKKETSYFGYGGRHILEYVKLNSPNCFVLCIKPYTIPIIEVWKSLPHQTYFQGSNCRNGLPCGSSFISIDFFHSIYEVSLWIAVSHAHGYRAVGSITGQSHSVIYYSRLFLCCYFVYTYSYSLYILCR